MLQIEESRIDFMKRLKAGEHLPCPCCDRYAQIYKRALHKGIALSLINLHKKTTHDQYLHIKDFCTIGGGVDIPLARFWGLVEAKSNDDGQKKTSGYWRLTYQGRLFVKNEFAVPKYVILYDNKSLGFEGESISIADALKDKFNYQTLMEANYG